MKQPLIYFIFYLVLISCSKNQKEEIDSSHINVTLDIARFDIDFYGAPSNLPSLKKQYPMLFPHDIDSIWVAKMKNKEELELFDETQKVFADFSRQEKDIKILFQHIKYYFPTFREPKIITLLTNLESRVVYANKYLFVSLDNFLGENHHFYNDFPEYIRQNNTPQHITTGIAKSIADTQIKSCISRRFIDKMIYEGKKMYLLDKYLPKVDDNLKIGYNIAKMNWAKASEENIWRFFVDKQMLYSTDRKLDKRFLEEAPFSKFYTAEDNNSPGQIGVYIGWQIVKAYMNNNNVSLQQLLETSEEEIFNKSKYKPRR